MLLRPGFDLSWSLSACIIYFGPASQTASAEKSIVNGKQAFINSCDKDASEASATGDSDRLQRDFMIRT